MASTLTDIFYIVRRAAGFDKADQAVDLCLQTFEICPVHRAILKQAQALAGRDFEDNVQTACAIATGLDAIVTRDPNRDNPPTHLASFASAPTNPPR